MDDPATSDAPLTVVALGGNALQRPGEDGSAEVMARNLASTVASMRPLLTDGRRIVIVHGNGPQVGNALLRSAAAAAEVPPQPLDVAGATTQAEIGTLLARELASAFESWGLKREVVVLVTHVRVDADDPALASPTKPIGPFHDSGEAKLLSSERGWKMVEDAGRGHRRVVGSPTPRAVIELHAIDALTRLGAVVVACGGGGIPVAHAGGRLLGVEAVIDKDRSSALLAQQLDAELLCILTAVDALYDDFGTPEATPIATLTAARARELLATGVLPAGSMAPKVEASASFAESTGRRALITDEASLTRAIAGAAGTWVTPG